MKTVSFFITPHALLAAAFLIGSSSRTHAQHVPDIVWSTNLYALGARVVSIAFSSAGAMLASCMGRTTSVWRVSEKALSHSFSTRSESLCAAFSNDRTLLAAGDAYGNVYIWRLPEGTTVRGGTISEGDNSTLSVAFSPNGHLFTRVASENGLRGIIKLPEFAPLLPFNYPEEVAAYDVQFSPNSAWLVAGFSDNTAKLYRISDGTLHRELSGHAGQVTSVDFSPDGQMLVTAATDGDARLWRVPEGQLIRTIRGGGGRSVDIYMGRTRFSADGKSLLSLSNGAVRFWSVADGRLLLTYPDLEAFSMAVSPDGKHFAYGTGGVVSTNSAVVLARWPVLFTGVALRSNALHLDWQGGSGVYQVQQTSNVASGAWENLGPPTTATNLTVPATNPAGFFRIQSLTNAP